MPENHVSGTKKLNRLLRPRRKNSQTVQLMFLLFLFAVGCAYADDESCEWCPLRKCFMTGVLLVRIGTLLQLAEICCRLTHVFEEITHLASRYQNSKCKLLLSLFPIDSSIAVTFFFVMLYIIFELQNIEDPVAFELKIAIIFTYMLFHLLNMKKNNVYYSINQPAGLDYGSGMAQSFYFGYLRLCLPDPGDSEKGIVERIYDYISQHGLSPASFPVKKLFILIPYSTYIPNDLSDVSDGLMSCVGSLEEQEKTRAGVKGRKYKNSVYKIETPDDPVYVVAEGATPCKTFNEVLRFSGNRKELYEANKPEITFKFFQTLGETLRENEECQNLCELIYYDDIDEHGENVNVALLLLERINEIKLKERTRRAKANRQK